MNFLFDNPLANMPGPAFLLFYGTIIVVSAIVFYLFKSRLDWTSHQPVPLIPNNPDPFEIAYLRGGENEFARAVIFSLTQKGFLKIINDGKKSYIGYAQTQPNWTTLSQLERAALSWFQTTRETSQIFGSFGLTETLKPFTTPFEQKMMQENLLTPDDVKRKIRAFSLLILGGIVMLGGYKLVAAMMHGRSNVAFLIVFTFIALIIFFGLAKAKRLSHRGTNYLGNLQNAFGKLKENEIISNQISPVFNAVDPMLLAVGIFGTSALVGHVYSDFTQAFRQASASGGGCGSSCGSSSCSSGGDGGGGCGGGGCGGCGG